MNVQTAKKTKGVSKPSQPSNMHVFIDTNILLNFFHFSKDELDALNNVFASHAYGAAKVHLTQQVCDEFRRNRESKIMDALKRFNEVRFNPQLPSFMKGYDEYEQIRKLSGQLQKLSKEIKDKVDKDITDRNLLADRLIHEIFSRSEIHETSPDVFTLSDMRVRIGNPPGKNHSVGDAINWTILLQSVPRGYDLHVISEDGDFYSILNENAVHPFLEEEWKKEKGSSLFVYRTLSAFMKEHFDGVAFSFDKTKDALIDDLRFSGSFSGTHQLISKLEEFSYYSLKEVERILAAAAENNQFGWIVTDCDVSDFLNRIAVPRFADISDDKLRSILDQVIKDQSERTAEK
ncbi:MAG: PIN domain-containing protein [Bdellovibrionales bacterium]